VGLITAINSSTYAFDLGKRGNVQIGDLSKDYFAPSVKFSKWGEVSLDFGLDTPDKNPPILLNSKELTWHDSSGLYSVSFKPEDPTPTAEDGGLGFDLIINKKPPSNVITLPINLSGIDALYQPYLTPTQIARGIIATKGMEGAYCFYHSTRGNMHPDPATADKFKTGKVGDLYCPLFRDAGGKEFYGDMRIDKGKLTITVPQEWWDAALYPVLVWTETFGNTSVPTYAAGSNAGIQSIWAKALTTPASNGSLTSITAYAQINAGTPSFNPAIYSDLSGYPNTRLAYVPSGGTPWGATYAWKTTNISFTDLRAGAQYWLGLVPGSDNVGWMFDYVLDEVACNAVSYWNDPATILDYFIERLGIYGTYEPRPPLAPARIFKTNPMLGLINKG